MTKSKGFTLIELMIVLAIIGILAAVIFPAISGKKATTFAGSNKPAQSANTMCIRGSLYQRTPEETYAKVIDQQGFTLEC